MVIYLCNLFFAFLCRFIRGYGALILFATVQLTMLSMLVERDRFSLPQWGLCSGMVRFGHLFLPGITAPPMSSALLMCGSGIAWALYTLRGQHGGDPTHATALNFIFSIPFASLFSVIGVSYATATLDTSGVVYAILSGAITSGMGYAIWYAVLPSMKASTAASLQLSVPIIAALAGVLLLDEILTVRLSIASICILGGVGLVLYYRQRNTV